MADMKRSAAVTLVMMGAGISVLAMLSPAYPAQPPDRPCNDANDPRCGSSGSYTGSHGGGGGAGRFHTAGGARVSSTPAPVTVERAAFSGSASHMTLNRGGFGARAASVGAARA